MRGLELLEGERVHRVLRMHPLCMLGAYGTVLGLLGLALVMGLFALGPGQGFVADLDASAGPFALVLLLAVWWVGLAAVAVPFAMRSARLWPVLYAVGVAVVGGIALIVATAPGPGARAALPWLPILTLLAVPLPLSIAEARRRSTTWVLTNLRVVRLHGLGRVAEASVRLPRIERVAIEHRGPARLDHGDLLLAVKGGDGLVIVGVRPLARVRDEVEMLLHTAPVAPYLAEQREAADKVRDLLRPDE
ncbi:MAG: hypothetical protein LC624_02360 [Halobacteriales archaeon]|nr:hypothetical protein [Halobacteriales archaeon]